MPNSFAQRQVRESLANAPVADASAPVTLDHLETVRIWGLDLARADRAGTVDLVDQLIARAEPGFFITANLHYAMLTARDPRLAAVNRSAAFIVADGMPMIWYSRLIGRPLPERVAGAELIYLLCQRAARCGHKVFFFGGSPDVAADAATRLSWMFPGLKIAGIETPELDLLSADEHVRLVERIRDARPALLFVALGQPKGELWLWKNVAALEIPTCVQLGASFDFVAGRVRRAPRWMQQSGLEWLFRMACDPKRLIPRYASNAWFLLQAVFRDLFKRGNDRPFSRDVDRQCR